MFYFKLFLIVLAGTLGIWFAVYRLVASTDHMTETFSHDTGYEARAKAEAKKKGDSHEEEVAKPVTAPPSNLATKISGEVMTVQTQSNADDEEKAMVAELKSVVEEDAKNKVVLAINSEDDANVDVQKKQTENQDSRSESSASERADSDADIQAVRNNDSEGISQNDNSRGKALDLDKKLANIIRPNDIAEKTEPDTIRAIDIAYAMLDNSVCVLPSDDNYPRIGVHYRPSSYAIKGKSLSNIDKIIAVYKKCGGKLLVIENKVNAEESDEDLAQLRQDEVKYYLLQRRVPKDDMIFSNN